MARTAARLWNLLAFLRPAIALQAATYVYVGAYLSGGSRQMTDGMLLTAALVVALTVSFGFVINDYADRELDRWQKPDRFLPAGLVRLEEAWAIAAMTALAALATAASLTASLQLLVWINLSLAVAYSFWLKRTVLLGNLLMATLNSSVILFGALAGAGLSPLVWSIAGTTWLFSLAQEVLYTVADRDGDDHAGIMTTAIYFGPHATLRLFRGLIIVAGLSAFVPLGLGYGSGFYLLLVLICTLGPIAFRLIPLSLHSDAGSLQVAVQTIKRVRAASLLPLLLLLPPG